MPTLDGGYDGRDLSPLHRQWQEHYLTKGCGQIKAQRLAAKKIRKLKWS